MANGLLHYRYWQRNWPSAVGLAIVTGVVLRNPDIAGGILVGYALGHYIDPDLDLVSIHSGESRLMRDLKIVGAVLSAWWLIYAYLMRFVGIGRRGHRNFFSHFPGISTAGRLIWLLAVPAVLWLHFELPVQIWTWYGLAGIWAGLTLADTIHYFLDLHPRRRR